MKSGPCRRRFITSSVIAFVLGRTFSFCFLVGLLGCVHAQSVPTHSVKPLRVSLFPYVPQYEELKVSIGQRWKAKFPHIDIKFVYGDCYDDNPPHDVDVFEFDAIYLEHLVRNGYLARLKPAEVHAVDDILPFALWGSSVDGRLYGIPHWSCTPVLFYRKRVNELATAKSIDDILKVVGTSTDTSITPENDAGLLVDLSGGTTCACFYLDAVSDQKEFYTARPPLPSSELLDSTAIKNLMKLTQMAGKKQALHYEDPDPRPAWFGQGLGKAMVGWTERLHFIPKDQHSNIAIRSLPLARKNAVNLFFLDLFGINPLLDGERRRLAVEFANLCASSDTVLEALLPVDSTKSSRYLLPVRASVLDSPQLRAAAPLYADLAVILRDNPRAFRVGEDVREWLHSTKEQIRGAITN